MEHAPCRLKQAKDNIIDAYKVVLLDLLDKKYIMSIGEDTVYLNDRGSRNRKMIDDIVNLTNQKADYRMGFTRGREGSPVTIFLDPKNSDIIAVADELQRLEDLQASNNTKPGEQLSLLDNDEFLFQLKGTDKSKSNEELDKYLLDFLKPFGVNSELLKTIKTKSGKDALGLTDVLNNPVNRSIKSNEAFLYYQVSDEEIIEQLIQENKLKRKC